MEYLNLSRKYYFHNISPHIKVPVNKGRVKKVLLLRLRPPVYDFCYHPIGFRPPYTLKYIESLLIKKEIYTVKLIDQRIANLSSGDILDIVGNWHPDLIVILISTLDIGKSLEFCRSIKTREDTKDIIIISTGQEMSSNIAKYRLFNTLFDVVLGGEAEQEAVSIIEKLNENVELDEIRDSYSQGRLNSGIIEIRNLDELPFPIYDTQSLKKYYFIYPLKVKKKLIWGHMLTSRGCPHSCIFCSQVMRETYGKRFRVRSAINVVDEMEGLLNSGANIIAFDDDNFTVSEEHVRSICREINSRELKVRWIAHARVDDVNPPLIKLMKESGCILLRFGIESGSEKIIKTLRKSSDSQSWFNKSKETISTVKSLGITVACFFIVGSPGETKEDFQKSIKFARDLSPDIIQVAYFTPFPDSTAYQIFNQQIKKDTIPQLYHYRQPLINLSSINDNELKRAQSMFYREFLMRPAFIIRHLFNYSLFYLNNPYIFSKYLRALKQMMN